MAAVATEIIEQFKAEATRAGALVHESKDADDAKNYVLKLAHERSVKHIVKSKSAVADASGLTAHLENAGIELEETDLGKWIAQLAGERSTGRKTIEQVTELISKATSEKLKPDPQVLLDAACLALRQSHIDADMGISEADIGIAETGTLVIVSNEGNARLVAVLPHLHVTIVDCENLVLTMKDAVVRLKSLGRSTMGGKMPSYVTYITGRNTTADIPGAILARAQGPAEEHIVLVNKSVGKRGAK